LRVPPARRIAAGIAGAADMDFVRAGGNAGRDEVVFLLRVRESIVGLRKLFPELLARCQLVGRWREVMRQGDTSDRTKQRLAQAEQERDDLRRHVLSVIDSSGDELADLKLLVTACVSLDDKLMDMPVARAVVEFGRSCQARRAEMMKRVKAMKALNADASAARVALSPGSGGARSESSAAELCESEELGVLREHLVQLSATLEALAKCDRALSRVRAESYVSKFELERAEAQLERQAMMQTLTRWCERNRAGETRAWEAHGELVGTILCALEESLDAALIAAVRDDIKRFVSEHSREQSRRGKVAHPHGDRGKARTASRKKNLEKASTRGNSGGRGLGSTLSATLAATPRSASHSRTAKPSSNNSCEDVDDGGFGFNSTRGAAGEERGDRSSLVGPARGADGLSLSKSGVTFGTGVPSQSSRGKQAGSSATRAFLRPPRAAGFASAGNQRGTTPRRARKGGLAPDLVLAVHGQGV